MLTVVLEAHRLVQSILYTAPPYNFSIVAVGATNWTSVLANPIGAVLAGWMADKYVLWRTKRNNNLREPEFRLPVRDTMPQMQPVIHTDV